MLETFNKPAIDVDGQITLLIERGLTISNPAQAKHYLNFIGYYRLSGYWSPFQLSPQEETDTPRVPHQFRDGTTFEDILEHYTFDRKLRLLVIDAIERIEVAIRTSLSNILCLNHGPHWFLNEKLFKKDQYFCHANFIESLDKHLHNNRNLPFIQHYNSKYNRPPYPPSWMIMEILPFGSISLIYQKLQEQSDRKQIASVFGINPRIMSSWIHAISYLRNLCAHHARVWNRLFTISPEIAKEHSNFLHHNNRFFAQAVILNAFLKIISPESNWPLKLKELFEEYPNMPIAAMGFPNDWYDNPFWHNS